MKQYWQLPDGAEELLPPEAARVEHLRYRLIDLFECWGYELVSPPLIEFMDSLMVGGGDDLRLSTLEVTDQVSGRTLGLRADISPQVARIDANKLLSEGVQRLCYAGSALLAKPPPSGAGRCPLKIGAEIYGCAHLEADVEILLLLTEALRLTQAPPFHIELGHVQVFRRLVASLGLAAEEIAALFSALQAKSASELEALISAYKVPAAIGNLLMALPRLMGDQGVLARAKTMLANAPEGVLSAIDELDQIAQGYAHRSPGFSLSFDLAEMQGYAYHGGVIYTAYADDLGQPIAFGGRYDGLGSAFGRSRAATGFDSDLKNLARLCGGEWPQKRRILAPWAAASDSASRQLEDKIAELRGRGDSVIFQLPATRADDIPFELQWRDDAWQVCPRS